MKGRLLGLAVLATATMVHAETAKLNAGNTVIAEEYLGSIGGVTTALTNAYQIFQPIAAGNRIQLTISNAKFSLGNATTITLCKGSTAVTETSTVSINTDKTVAILKVNRPIGNGEVYYFVRGNSTACDPTKVSNYIQYSLTGLKAGDSVVLTVTGLDYAAGIADAQATVARIKKQFSAEVKATSAKIDLTTFKTFVSDMTGLVSSDTIKARFKIISDETIPSTNRVPVTNGTNICDGQLPQNWVADFTLKGKLQEYSKIGISTPTQDIKDKDRNNGQVTIAGFDLNANSIVCKTNTANPAYSYIALKVDGQTPIQEDTKKLSIKLKKGSYSSDLITDATAFIITLNATTLYVPLVAVSSDGKRETYIKLQMSNNTLKSTNVTFFILADDGSIVATYNKTLTAGKPLVVTGSELKNAAIAAGKTISGDSFAVKIIVVNRPEEIYAYANIVDPSGAKRVPVKVLYDLNDQNERARFIAE
jgi:hypothetical protein